MDDLVQRDDRALVIHEKGVLAVSEAVLRHIAEDWRSASTRAAYEGDLKLFFAWGGYDVGAGTDKLAETAAVRSALADICILKTGPLAILLNRYKAYLMGLGISPATINRRLSAVRSMLKQARRFGLTEVSPDDLVDNEKSRKYRDTRGPELEEVRAVLAAPDQSSLAGKRDYAMLRLMWENALRRGSVVALAIEDFDPKRKRIQITTKGHGGEPEYVTITAKCCKAIEAYLEERTGGRRLDNGSPIFVNHKPGHGGRLSGRGLYGIVCAYGFEALDRKLNPHAFGRHAATTVFLELSGGDVRSAQALTGHSDIRTLQHYDDKRADLQGAATKKLSEAA